LINSRGCHDQNNAQQITRLFRRSPQAGRAKTLPSHYDLLRITASASAQHSFSLVPVARDAAASFSATASPEGRDVRGQQRRRRQCNC
ncbi:MAG: hypothetical protein AB1582_21885, partial [Pseudomonadota bacterium]